MKRGAWKSVEAAWISRRPIIQLDDAVEVEGEDRLQSIFWDHFSTLILWLNNNFASIFIIGVQLHGKVVPNSTFSASSPVDLGLSKSPHIIYYIKIKQDNRRSHQIKSLNRVFISAQKKKTSTIEKVFLHLKDGRYEKERMAQIYGEVKVNHQNRFSLKFADYFSTVEC
jgi:hypothetical protein